MDWYYAINEEKHGPVAASQLADLSRCGTLLADDFVWREGFLEWRPFRQIADEVFGEGADGPVETAVCAHSRRALPVAEMIPYGDQWIDPDYKDNFLQQLMETGANPSWRSRLVVRQIPVGFWTRLLALVLDHLILFLPTLLCLVPFFISSNSADLGEGGEWTRPMIVSYSLGLLASFTIHGAYHIWMIGGRHRATLGKQAFGAIVTLPDGGRVTHLRALARFLAWSVVNQLFFFLCAFGGAFLTAMFLGTLAGGALGVVLLLMFTFLPLTLLFSFVGLFPFWMAGLDSRKRALHDRLCSTVVIRKAH